MPPPLSSVPLARRARTRRGEPRVWKRRASRVSRLNETWRPSRRNAGARLPRSCRASCGADGRGRHRRTTRRFARTDRDPGSRLRASSACLPRRPRRQTPLRRWFPRAWRTASALPRGGRPRTPASCPPDGRRWRRPGRRRRCRRRTRAAAARRTRTIVPESRRRRPAPANRATGRREGARPGSCGRRPTRTSWNESPRSE